jgi:hypothetical protein
MKSAAVIEAEQIVVKIAAILKLDDDARGQAVLTASLNLASEALAHINKNAPSDIVALGALLALSIKARRLKAKIYLPSPGLN